MRLATLALYIFMSRRSRCTPNMEHDIHFPSKCSSNVLLLPWIWSCENCSALSLSHEKAELNFVENVSTVIFRIAKKSTSQMLTILFSEEITCSSPKQSFAMLLFFLFFFWE